jgi:DNA-binding response OmpR family regulator
MRTIIIQDRNADIRELLTFILEMEGYNVVALEHFDSDLYNTIGRIHPDAVIVEYNYKKNVDADMIKNIKCKMNYVPVLGLLFDNLYSQKLKTLGFDDFVLKPFDFNALHTTIANNITLSQSLQSGSSRLVN